MYLDFSAIEIITKGITDSNVVFIAIVNESTKYLRIVKIKALISNKYMGLKFSIHVLLEN